jgi:short-subunit dehydrogenase
MNLILVARRSELLSELRQQLSSEYQIQIRCLQLDLSQDGCLKPLIDLCRDLDVGLVVNNAGSGIPGPFSSSNIQLEKAFIQLNCVTPVEITHHFLQGMLAKKKGGIILVSSLMGFQGVPFMANYSATKGYLLNFGESLFHECRGTGVDILVLAPGATETPGKYLHKVDYSKLPITWMTADVVVDTAMRNLGRRAFVIPGLINHLTACFSGGLWSRGLVQGVMKKLARLALPGAVSSGIPSADSRANTSA